MMASLVVVVADVIWNGGVLVTASLSVGLIDGFCKHWPG